MTEYTTIKVYTNERARYEGKELGPAIVSYIRSLKIAARCVVLRGIEGCYENGEAVTNRMIELSYDMPLIIEMLLPAAESAAVIQKLESMVTDGIVSVSPAEVTSFRAPSSLLPHHLLVRDMMTPRPIDGHENFSVRVAVELLLDNQLKSLPIVDDRGLVLGIVTQCDLMKRAGMPLRLGLLRSLPEDDLAAWLAKAEGLKVTEVMTPKPQTVREDHKAAEAIHLMVHEKLKRLPVVDAKGKLCGMVSRIDVLKALSPKPGVSVEATPLPSFSEHPRLVRDIAARDRLVMRSDTSLRTAIDLLAQDETQRAVVVDEEGRLLGLITDAMLVKAVDRASSGFFLLRRRAARRAGMLKVADIMERDIVSVTEETPIDEAIRLMTERGFKRLPVIDSEHRFSGMIRRDSVLIALSRLI